MKVQKMCVRHLGETAWIFYSTLRGHTRREVADYLLSREGTWVAVEAGRVVGFYQAVAFDRQRELWLDFVGVDRRFRRTGVGRLLLGHLEKQAESFGFAEIALSVLRSNAGALALYQRLQYRVSPCQPTAGRVSLFRGLRPEMARNPEAFRLRPRQFTRKLVLTAYLYIYLLVRESWDEAGVDWLKRARAWFGRAGFGARG